MLPEKSSIMSMKLSPLTWKTPMSETFKNRTWTQHEEWWYPHKGQFLKEHYQAKNSSLLTKESMDLVVAKV